jgi:class 3 adenylate cyclase/putative methionine-R-sulfoxide reductase with GAF domain
MFEVGGIKGDLSFDELAKHYPLPVDERLLPGKAVLAGRPMQLSPIVGNVEAPSNTQRMAIEFGFNAQISVPLIRDGEAIGALSAARRDALAFTDEQVALIKSFAAQAVIAIENARLLNELRQRTTDLTERTDDLTEALEQQTATSEVLQAISGSPGDLQPVFAIMLENMVRVCHASFGAIHRCHGDFLQFVAEHNSPSAYANLIRRSPFRPGPHHYFGPMIASKSVEQFADLAASQGYLDRRPEFVTAVELGGVRTALNVPMLKENELIGAFALARKEVRPFTDKQIELVTNFAAQAVIAIENARLLNEQRQSLEQQTATSKVLQVISSATFDLQTVLDTLVQSALHLCHADASAIWRPDGDLLRMVSIHGDISNEFLEYARQNPLKITRASLSGRTILEGRTVHIPDVQSEPEMRTVYQSKGKHRTALGVPLSRKGEIIGVFALVRYEVRPFTDKQIELVTTFADQAVIAIENTRLLTELRQRTDQLEAQSQQLADLNQQLEQRVADQVGEIERMSRLRRFLPPQVADLIVASGSEKQLESHRREITALFCDLRGFTGFTESADAEDVMALLRDYHAAIGELVVKYSGTLERYAGDGVMVIFNDPVPVENPALQAVLMALELRDALGALTATWSRLGHEIGFGIGIAHGFATLGTIGFEGRFDYAAIGTVSNVASRLCDEAKPGQILISPRVLMKVENAVKVEPVGEFELKGIRRLLAAYNVVATSSSKV